MAQFAAAHLDQRTPVSARDAIEIDAGIRLTPPTRVSPRGTSRIARWGGAGLIHILVVLLFVGASTKIPPATTGFGGAVSVTLVNGGPSRSGTTAASRPALDTLANRLSAAPEVPAQRALSTPPPPPTTSLSDLMNEGVARQGAQTASIGGATSSDLTSAGDDPFSRASISFRGADPQKIARLQAQVQACAKMHEGAARLLLLIDAEGRLQSKPRVTAGLAPGSGKAASLIAAIERCGAFTAAASPGAPRSYEVEIR